LPLFILFFVSLSRQEPITPSDPSEPSVDGSVTDGTIESTPEIVEASDIDDLDGGVVDGSSLESVPAEEPDVPQLDGSAPAERMPEALPPEAFVNFFFPGAKETNAPCLPSSRIVAKKVGPDTYEASACGRCLHTRFHVFRFSASPCFLSGSTIKFDKFSTGISSYRCVLVSCSLFPVIHWVLSAVEARISLLC
jgi:hypothetical protein